MIVGQHGMATTGHYRLVAGKQLGTPDGILVTAGLYGESTGVSGQSWALCDAWHVAQK